MLIERSEERGKKELILSNDWSHVVKGKIHLSEREREREKHEKKNRKRAGDIMRDMGTESTRGVTKYMG